MHGPDALSVANQQCPSTDHKAPSDLNDLILSSSTAGLVSARALLCTSGPSSTSKLSSSRLTTVLLGSVLRYSDLTCSETVTT